jgi:hypothetical protein
LRSARTAFARTTSFLATAFFRLSEGGKTLGEGLEVWVVSDGDHGGYEEDGLEALTSSP